MVKSSINVKFSEVDLACDVQSFVNISQDVTFDNEEDKNLVFDSEDTDLLMVTKTIASPIKIVNVEKIDEDYINKNI